MTPVLFVDCTCPAPYSARTVLEAALGGTEATVTRIAEALDAGVMQHNRREAEGRYVPLMRAQDVKHVVVLRDPKPLRDIRDRFPGAHLYLWLHDLVRPGSKRGRRIAASASMLNEMGVQIVCVSDFQRRGVEAVLREAGQLGVDVRTIYNPVEERLRPDTSAVDPTKLVFFSSPNKGLAYTLDAFEALRRRIPDMRLHVGNPGYKNRRLRQVDGVEWIGALPHARILEEVRTALCVFYPNFVLPETFGLVLAEANAVGTPVITHDCGAASEVLEDSRQVLPVTAAQRMHERLSRFVPLAFQPRLARWSADRGVFAPYIERITEWKAGARPRTGPDSRFKLGTIADQWRAMFAGEPAFLAGLPSASSAPSSSSSESSKPEVSLTSSSNAPSSS